MGAGGLSRSDSTCEKRFQNLSGEYEGPARLQRKGRC